MTKVINVENLKKTFRVGDQDVEVLKGVSYAVEPGDFLMLVGPSGCGKSTMMNISLGLESPTSGKVSLLGYDITPDLDHDACGAFRKQKVGIVYQQSHWVKSLSVRENVALPLILNGESRSDALRKSIEKLKLVEMVEWSDYVPTELSSGQQQRVALARALMNSPQIIFADEPTGNLDNVSGTYVMDLFKRLNVEEGVTVLMVTHDLEYMPYANRAIKMDYGLIAQEYSPDEFDELIPAVIKSQEEIDKKAIKAQQSAKSVNKEK